MREIKFRAWDGTKMHTPFTLDSALMPNKEDEGFWERGNIFLQFTGRTAKDGSEIYEGDTVLVQGRKRTGEYVTTVIQSNQGWTLERNDTYFNDDACFVAIRKVTGNIYETPIIPEKHATKDSDTEPK